MFYFKNSWKFNVKKKYLTTCFIFTLAFSSTSFSWSNYFRFVNNFNYPVIVSITPDAGWYDPSGIHNLCNSAKNNTVADQSVSCEYQFTDGKMNWYSQYGSNEGIIKVSKKDDTTSYCTFHYYYSRSSYKSYFDVRSEKISLPDCHGQFSQKEFSVVTDHNKALARPLDGNVIFNIDGLKAAEVTESLSQADCGGKGGDNCIIFSPDLNKKYINNGSSLEEMLGLQAKLSENEPLNFEQFLGGHNSAVSRHYTGSNSPYNLSYSDPDAYSNLTDQLNEGVRQIELDIQWYNNKIVLCHNHVSDLSIMKNILCADSYPVVGDNKKYPLNEISE
ncbi:PI-PLC domain-containing protein [Piscirickettsia litoralis]|uniref:Uncharacterized protein n=1 Tax=Piscirickettsia litoralis TaxID=1891921 RepID=A0ABX3A560_9GAMM|nr:hypothetical protein [Piscirickettsia litoralis]ODN43563.1 hypothetical protein BGC07_12375 [Piscirickettsia litoralis]